MGVHACVYVCDRSELTHKSEYGSVCLSEYEYFVFQCVFVSFLI